MREPSPATTCQRRAASLALVLVFTMTGGVFADELPVEGLPDPLSLEQALRLLDISHPTLEAAAAVVDDARAALAQAKSNSGVDAYLELIPRTSEPALALDEGRIDDSRARLVINKPLYDFGYTKGRKDTARLTLDSRQLAFLDVRQQRYIEIMQRYFDVLLADMRYAVDNEAMVVRFLDFDKARERHALGILSDVKLLELESMYQDGLITRTKTQQRQSSTRAALAQVLNQPDSLPSQLVRPELPDNERETPEYEDILRLALEHNPNLRQLRREVAAAEAALAAERASKRPVISAELEAAEYERRLASRDELRASLNIHIPIYQRGAAGARIAAAMAQMRKQRAGLTQAEYQMRQVVIDLVQEIETLRVERRAARVRSDYRDLALQEARGRYELEMATTLGGVTIHLTEAQWLADRVEFQLALAWARLDALTGRLLESSHNTLQGEP